MREPISEADLRDALEREALTLHYQPQVALPSGRIIAVEALARWIHPRLGAVSPARFVPLAERCGLIDALGRWVLRTACRQAASLQSHYPPTLRLAVNLSPLHVLQEDLAAQVRSALADGGLSPALLELEITEGRRLQRSEGVVERLQALRAMGVTIALDDFGVGHSNLSYLTWLPVDTLKIDGSLVRDAESNPKAAAVVRSTLALAHELGLRVVAECVETDAQLSLLAAATPKRPVAAGRDHGCAQGWYFSPAIPFDELASGAAALQAEIRERARRVLDVATG